MQSNRIVYEKPCVQCRLFGGLLFSGMLGLHVFRVTGIWRLYSASHKMFNVFAGGFLSLLAGANFHAAYTIMTTDEADLP